MSARTTRIAILMVLGPVLLAASALAGPGSVQRTPAVTNLSRGAAESQPDVGPLIEKALRDGDIGGDDVVIHSEPGLQYIDIDVATSGDIYVAMMILSSSDPEEIRVFRSQDGGDSWQSWGILSHATFEYKYPKIHVAEGAADRCFVAYSKYGDGPNSKICVAGCDLSLPVGDFSSEIVVMEDPSAGFLMGDIGSDAASWNDYYLYLVASRHFSDTSEIWFTRSNNQGTSFDSPYAIGGESLSDLSLRTPTVAYGFGGYVHVAWHNQWLGDVYDNAVRYRRAASYANGGISAWGPVLNLTSDSNGLNEATARVDASLTDGQVVVAHHSSDPGINSGIMFHGSSDQGATFTVSHTLLDGVSSLQDFAWQPATGNWVAAAISFIDGVVVRSAGSDITTWSAPEAFAVEHSSSNVAKIALAIDPSRSDRLAFLWDENCVSVADHLSFDAEWRRDPGYPNLEEGFPVDLTFDPISGPAVVDLDGDSDLEIVFSDLGGQVQAFHHDGTPVAGWPVTVPGGVSNGPVAIGDLRGNGDQMVVVGGNFGQAHAFEANGDLADGWPFDTGTGTYTFVSIGALGGPYPRMAAICAGDRLYFVNNSGSAHHGTYWSWPGRTFNYPVAIGDIDGDGVSEAVGAASALLFAVHATEPVGVFGVELPSLVSSQVSLGDLDLDGDMEVIAPTMSGVLYAYQGDGSPVAGTWPFVSPTGSPLSSAVLGDMLGTSEPEMVFASWSGTVHLAYHHGGEGIGYPVQADGESIYGGPIIGRVDGSSSDVVAGSWGDRGWAWDNFGGLIPGWPKWFDNFVNKDPAMGDLDLDGSTEIVFVTINQLIVVDINQVPNAAASTWPMYGHDPQRTGCSDCPEDVVTAVDPDDGGEAITRVFFAAPSPNPAAGPMRFSYEVPSRAVVSLDVYDVRGQRVDTVVREEFGPGTKVEAWDGRDRQGRALPSGVYYARLRVKGPGVDEEEVRKVTLVR